jgi:hypothetical protein
MIAHSKQQPQQPMNHDDECIVREFTRMKEGEVVELNGKTFTKWAGLLVAPDVEAIEWIKTNVSAEFFNKYVVRIMDASPERFSQK